MGCPGVLLHASWVGLAWAAEPGPESGVGTVGTQTRDSGIGGGVPEARDWTIDRLRHGDTRSEVAKLETLPLATVLEHVDLSMALGLAAGLSGDTTLARAFLAELKRVERSGGLPAAARIALAHLELALCMWDGRMVDVVGAAEVLEAELRSARDVPGQPVIIGGSSTRAALAAGVAGSGALGR